MKSMHSTQWRRLTARVMGLAAMSCACWAQESPWLDFEARIQYAFYTEDVRALANLTELLASRQDEDAMRHYYEGLANYRLALLTVANGSVRSGAAEHCVASLERVLSRQPDLVEPLALQAACLDTVGKLKSLRAPLAAPRARSHIARAIGLAPRNPRVLLMEASGKDAADAEKTLRQAIAAFETERQGVPHVPSWGAADAYVALGSRCLDRGDVLGARDALERALLIAPEFAAARKLLERVTSG